MSDGAGRIQAFRRRIRAHYRAHGRSTLPWRRTKNPYRIVVSEFMLQQTQASRVVPKYLAFLRRFPSIHALAAAPRADVLLAWQGLGYNRRALMLHETARRIVRDHGGTVPDDMMALRALPGVGPYTAAAVRIFAFNRPEVCIETNIRSVFLHEFFPGAALLRGVEASSGGPSPRHSGLRARDGGAKARVSDRRLLPLIQQTLDRRNPRVWYEALMDYGSTLKQAVPNPSRRAAGYVRSLRFAGSTRYARGRILALALQGRSFADGGAAHAAHGASAATVRKALEGLIRDVMLVRTRGRYRLAA